MSFNSVLEVESGAFNGLTALDTLSLGEINQFLGGRMVTASG